MRKIKLLALLVALVYATSSWGTAYNAGTIDLRDLQVGDILMAGVTVSHSSGDDWLYLDGWRYEISPSYTTSDASTINIYPVTIGDAGVIVDAEINTYYPIVSGTTRGNAWQVTFSGDDVDLYNCHCTPYNVTIVGITYNGEGVAAGSGSSTPVVIPEGAVDLSTLSSDYTAVDGDVLAGTLGANIKISIEAGASVTLNNATINGTDNLDYKWAGLNCLGDATITLVGINTVKGFQRCYPGIFVPATYALTIEGEGSLNVSSNGSGAAIGSAFYKNQDFSCEGCSIEKDPCGNIVINGGNITAVGGNYSAAIGAGGDNSCGDITINGGIIHATGNDGPAIGAGRMETKSGQSCGNITITGGTIIADYDDDYGAAGIGTADNGVCGDILISGGTITATGGEYAAGIGAGNSSATCGSITISGGTVTATGGESGAGIGSGEDATCGSITISGGTVTATGGESGAGIGSGSRGTCENISITGGIVVAEGGEDASGIGSGEEGTCGTVTIGANITSVSATCTPDATNPIGAGDAGTCGAVTVASGLSDVTSGNTRLIQKTYTLTISSNDPAMGSVAFIFDPHVIGSEYFATTSETSYSLAHFTINADYADGDGMDIKNGQKVIIASKNGEEITGIDFHFGYGQNYAEYMTTSVGILNVENGNENGSLNLDSESGVTEVTFSSTYTSYLQINEVTVHYPDILTLPIGVTDNGDGTYSVVKGTELTVRATAEDGFNFVEWEDHSTATDRNITVNADMNIVATFAAPAPEDFAIHANLDPQHAGTYYSTFYHSGAEYTLPTGVEAFKATISGDALYLSSVAVAGQSIPAGNAVILKSNAQDYTLAVSEATSSAFEGNALRGVDTNTPVGDVVTSGTCYVLSGHSADNSVQGVGFYQYASTSTLQAHKAYVVIGETTGAPKRMRFVFDSTTDVENAESSDISVQKILRDGQLIIIRGDREFNVQGQIVK